jgi:hypothetical protein
VNLCCLISHFGSHEGEHQVAESIILKSTFDAQVAEFCFAASLNYCREYWYFATKTEVGGALAGRNVWNDFR